MRLENKIMQGSLFQSKDEPEGRVWAVAEESSFRGWILTKCSSRSRGGGNVESAPLVFALSKEEKNPRSWGWGIILFRHFHGPSPAAARSRTVCVWTVACAGRLRCRCGQRRCVVRRRE